MHEMRVLCGEQELVTSAQDFPELQWARQEGSPWQPVFPDKKSKDH